MDVYVLDETVVPSWLGEDIDFLEGQFPMAGYIFWFTPGRGRTWLRKAGGPFSN